MINLGYQSQGRKLFCFFKYFQDLSAEEIEIGGSVSSLLRTEQSCSNRFGFYSAQNKTNKISLISSIYFKKSQDGRQDYTALLKQVRVN